MKKALTTVLLLSGIAFGQTSTKELSSDKFGNLTLSQYQKITGIDTNEYFCLTFKNLEYQYVTDFAVDCQQRSEWSDFADLLEQVIKDPSARYSSGEYTVFKNVLGYSIYLGRKFTSINEKNAQKLIVKLRSLSNE